MKAIFDDRQWHHDPQNFMANGRILPNPEKPRRIEVLKAAAEEGLGIISQPTFLIGQAINEGRLVPILTGIDWWQLGAYALYPPGRHLSAKVRALVDHLVTCFGDPPYWDDIVFESVRPRPRVLAG